MSGRNTKNGFSFRYSISECTVVTVTTDSYAIGYFLRAFVYAGLVSSWIRYSVVLGVYVVGGWAGVGGSIDPIWPPQPPLTRSTGEEEGEPSALLKNRKRKGKWKKKRK